MSLKEMAERDRFNLVPSLQSLADAEMNHLAIKRDETKGSALILKETPKAQEDRGHMAALNRRLVRSLRSASICRGGLFRA